MYVSCRYLGIKKGNLKYLFLLLIEDYQDSIGQIRDSLRPLIEHFARDLGHHGAVIVPFKGDASDNLCNVLEKAGWRKDESDMWEWFRNNCPAILIIDRDVDVFNPKEQPYIIISLRQSMDEMGNVKVFELRELFTLLVENAQRSDLFQKAPPELLALDRSQGWKALEAKPGIWGFAFDLKRGVEWLKQRRVLTHQYTP